MPDNLDALRAAILRMQAVGDSGVALEWLLNGMDPLADDRLHELFALAMTLDVTHFEIEYCHDEVIVRLYGGPGADTMAGGNFWSGSAIDLSVALARAIVAAKGGADGH